ncbi:unnamed protein product (macronuclear) [Paramecium tetraurelia]|uniref:Uncharacterized protein n=1 Tax=Paramecium tetraurelia TaxID=5888 RepID=A0CGC1_PARTE|nr:uncharacterized protein GSPATT00007278001 [Paramecium tetraurelia]CAK69838.1 unnamed protein product [Paramecium tetraurelia]|eukprot:XP_001437235.1 hypothetical protein (macronuclear) [Paramecium tetraurelia strain d4-2]
MKNLKMISQNFVQSTWIYQLDFAKRSNQLITTFEKNRKDTIQFYSIVNLNCCKRLYEIRINLLYSIKLSYDENLIIIGGSDSIDLFKNKQAVWQKTQSIELPNCYAKDLDINQESSILITLSEESKKIFILNQSGFKWEIVQEIKNKDFGRKLCFITNESFVVTFQFNGILFYQFNTTDLKFQMTKQILIQKYSLEECKFLKFIQSQQLLLLQYGCYCNFIQFKDKELNTVEYKCNIEQGSIRLVQISDDGNYLVTVNRDNQLDLRRQTYPNFNFNLVHSFPQINQPTGMVTNHDASILVLTYKGQFQVLKKDCQQFNVIQITDLQDLNCSCLYFMKNSNQFIIGSIDDEITIWLWNSIEQQYKQQTKIIGPSFFIIMNPIEDLLIFAKDRYLTFWEKKQDGFSMVQILRKSEYVHSQLSINESGTKLCAVQYDCSIVIIIQEVNWKLKRKWMFHSKIKTDAIGIQSALLTETKLLIKQKNISLLDLYELNNDNNLLIKIKQTQLIQNIVDDQIQFLQSLFHKIMM